MMPKLRLVLEIEAPENIEPCKWTAFVRDFNELADELLEIAEEGKAEGYKVQCDVEPFMSLTCPTSGPPWARKQEQP